MTLEQVITDLEGVRFSHLNSMLNASEDKEKEYHKGIANGLQYATKQLKKVKGESK